MMRGAPVFRPAETVHGEVLPVWSFHFRPVIRIYRCAIVYSWSFLSKRNIIFFLYEVLNGTPYMRSGFIDWVSSIYDERIGSCVEEEVIIHLTDFSLKHEKAFICVVAESLIESSFIPFNLSCFAPLQSNFNRHTKVTGKIWFREKYLIHGDKFLLWESSSNSPGDSGVNISITYDNHACREFCLNVLYISVHHVSCMYHIKNATR